MHNFHAPVPFRISACTRHTRWIRELRAGSAAARPHPDSRTPRSPAGRSVYFGSGPGVMWMPMYPTLRGLERGYRDAWPVANPAVPSAQCSRPVRERDIGPREATRSLSLWLFPVRAVVRAARDLSTQPVLKRNYLDEEQE